MESSSLSSAFGLALSPLLPWPLLVGLAVCGLGLIAWGLFRRARGILLRAVALAVLLAVLVNPQVIEETRSGLPDVALVVVDGSASMDLAGRRDRAEAAASALAQTLGRDRSLEVRVVAADRPEAGGGTRLFSALSRAAADVPRQRLAGAVLITDGQVHDAPKPEEAAGAFPAPLHVLLTGKAGESDRRLEAADGTAFALVGKSAALRVTVIDSALPDGTPVPLTATLEDGTELSVRGTVGRPVEVVLPVRHAGANVVEIEAPVRPGELTAVNNRLALSVSGVRDRLRVLLVSGEPHLGERAWRNLLKADPNVDLVHFTILRPPTKDDGTPLSELALIAFPIRELFQEKLADFDLVIFDRYSRQGLVPSGLLSNIADYVRGGGALLAAVGPEYFGAVSLYDSPLASILPAAPTGAAVPGPFRPALNAVGRRHPVTAGLGGNGEAATWGRWLRHIPAQVRQGETLMQAGTDGAPLLALARVDKGRTALVLSDTLWLWGRGFEGGGPQVELIRRLAHWLMQEPDLEEEALTATVDNGRLTIEHRTLAAPEEAPPAALVTAPGGNQRAARLSEAAPGRWRGSLPADQPGLYRVEAGGRTTVAAAGLADPLESSAVEATAARLGPMVKATGGGVFWLDPAVREAGDGLPAVRRVEADGRASGAGWMGLRANHDHVVTGIRQAALLAPALAVMLVLAGLLLAWWREGR